MSTDHPRRRRGPAGRHPGRQGHPQGRNRADRRGTPAAGHFRREGPGSPGHLAPGAPRRIRKGGRRQGLLPGERRRTAAGSQPAGPGLCRPEAEDLRGGQDGRPAREQRRDLPDPAGGGYALPAGRDTGGDRPESPGGAFPNEYRPGSRVPPGPGRPGNRNVTPPRPVYRWSSRGDIMDTLGQLGMSKERQDSALRRPHRAMPMTGKSRSATCTC